VVFISSHVDDYLVTGNDIQGVRELKEAMAKRFKMKDMGSCVSYLGMEVKRNKEAKTIYLCQAKYITLLLEDTGLLDSTPKATLMESRLELEPVKAAEAVRQEDFKKLVGKI
jgi:Reverse transcriptase (RNA-dependent DNA polymerase)